MNKSLVKNLVKVEIHDETNEGYFGDYDENDKEDKKLLRFEVFSFSKGEWVYVEDSSYCTRIPSNSNEEVVNRILNLIMKEIYEDVVNNISIKKKCEKLSWIE